MRRPLKFPLPVGGGEARVVVAGAVRKWLLVDFGDSPPFPPALFIWAEVEEATDGSSQEYRLVVLMTGEEVPGDSRGEHLGSAQVMLPGGPYVVHVYRLDR